jgi:hypothetical protein
LGGLGGFLHQVSQGVTCAGQCVLRRTGYTSTWYFPGLFTSFVIGAVVIRLIHELRRNYHQHAAPYPALGDGLGTAG